MLVCGSGSRVYSCAVVVFELAHLDELSASFLSRSDHRPHPVTEAERGEQRGGGEDGAEGAHPADGFFWAGK